LVLGREAFAAACGDVPISTGECDDAVLVDRFGDAVADALRGRVELGGIGVGVCGRVTDPVDYDAFRPSLSVFAWEDADAAVEAVHRQLQAWDIGGHFGVSVRGHVCTVPASAPG
jgi:hypothetical protein